jgi:release factor glutamine methyltransferase
MNAGTDKKTWTVLELLNWTADYLRRSGVDNPRLSAEVLLGNILGLERIMLYARFDESVGADQRGRFRELVKRRAAREPLQYLTGGWEFYGRRFELNPAVLIPRPETELLVERCLELLPDSAGSRWAADIGTGSGIIAVTLAVERRGLHVVATDVSAEALEVASRNAEGNRAASRIRFVQGDLAGPVRPALPKGVIGLDLLASNPPYVPTAQIPGLQPEVRDHEPRWALDGGLDGLDVIRRLVPQAAELLAPGGWMVLELGSGQADAVDQMVAATNSFDVATATTMTDAAGCQRVLSVRKQYP